MEKGVCLIKGCEYFNLKSRFFYCINSWFKLS